jgi:hypothetical protein
MQAIFRHRRRGSSALGEVLNAKISDLMDMGRRYGHEPACHLGRAEIDYDSSARSHL